MATYTHPSFSPTQATAWPSSTGNVMRQSLPGTTPDAFNWATNDELELGRIPGGNTLFVDAEIGFDVAPDGGATGVGDLILRDPDAADTVLISGMSIQAVAFRSARAEAYGANATPAWFAKALTSGEWRLIFKVTTGATTPAAAVVVHWALKTSGNAESGQLTV